MIRIENAGVPDGKGQRELELYLHIPFCVRKCKYCDFLSAPADAQVQNAYMEALRREVQESADKAWVPMAEKADGADKAWVPMAQKADGADMETVISPGQCEVTSIYIGGGTPSVVNPAWITRLMTCIRECYSVAEQAEITLEINPGTVTRESLLQYKQTGINRLSIGCQSTDDGELARIGRIHTFAQFLDAYRWAREAGFANVNVDLMNALPGQEMADVERNLERLLMISPRPEHISVYSLIVEEETPFYQMWEKGELAVGAMRLPDEELEREMYWRTAEYLKAQGYEHYEISNFALPGCESRHNCGYWERRDYLGFGLGAASLYGGMRFSNTRDLREYMAIWSGTQGERIKAQGKRLEDRGREQIEQLSVQDEMEETMFLGLRMAKGVSVYRFREQFGCELEEVYGAELEESIREGLMEKKVGAGADRDARYVLTARGVDVSNYVMAKFLQNQDGAGK
ncbi:MAG: radical SAM family heme chaperone HemW [Lachnospiraceae bacterium]|nr:radical SAM family heme chaperone HemW [Lachnospiraceae bacterium]